MVDPILARYLWQERDHDLTVRAERERQFREGRPQTPSASQRLRTVSGEALISLGYWLKSHDTHDTDNRALAPASALASLSPRHELDSASPYSFIYYSRMLPAGPGRGGGLMLLSLTWLPIQPAPAQP